MIGQRLISSMTVLLLLSASPLWAQTDVNPGFNLFSPEQDVEIGRNSAAEVENQLPLLNDRRVQEYVDRIGQRLARNAPGPDFPYQFKVVNVSDINAFALPGGYMYVNRGLIEAARSEAELAGVMAHEISHVALRHGTNQASKAYLASAGFSLLGVFLGDRTSRSTEQIISSLGGFGLNSLFLKFSRTAETQADVVGAQILAASGYNPMAMAEFFELLHQQAGRDQSGLETFFSSHPAPEDRSQRIQQEIDLIGGYRRQSNVGNFEAIQSRLDRTADAPSMRDLQSGAGGGGGGDSPRTGEVEPPSSRWLAYEADNRAYRIDHPSNWQPFPHQGFGVTFAPQGGIGQVRGRTEVAYGAILERFRFSSRARQERDLLEDGSQAYLQDMLQTNSHLRQVSNWRRVRIGQRQALNVTLAGRSPATGFEEHVEVYTMLLDNDEILYLLQIVPEDDYGSYRRTFRRMAGSLDIR